MKRTAKEKNPPESARLSRDDWLDAAFDAVVEGGFDSVRVLLLADRLGVTRGSFYWHFKDHADLVDSLIRRWHQSEIETDRKLGGIRSDDPGADLMQILDVALARGSGDLKEMRFELGAQCKHALLLREYDGWFARHVSHYGQIIVILSIKRDICLQACPSKGFGSVFGIHWVAHLAQALGQGVVWVKRAHQARHF